MSTENFSSLFVTVVTYVPFNSFILVEIRDSLRVPTKVRFVVKFRHGRYHGRGVELRVR